MLRVLQLARLINFKTRYQFMDQKPQSHARRDKLLAIEKDIQNFWEANSTFFANPDPTKPKFFLTFPFPYANGRLHLGHGFSWTKCEFTARYKRLQGYNVLLPFAFHCTGMPISASAKKLTRELDLLQNNEPPQPGSQYDNLLKMGISKEEIPNFTDPYYWIRYFPPFGKTDLIRLGSSVDWRRTFITTDANPYYNSFIEWHMAKLKDGGFIKFGKRPSIFSALDDQMCADHDRRSGEGVNPQEYTLIKQQILLPEKIDVSLAGKKVFLVCATLRPETMYGQTNTFVLPEGEYGVFEMLNDELFICSERSALNMAYQDLTKEPKKVIKVLTLKGVQLIGLEIKAPLTSYEKVYILPMSTIKMNKATGVVTSVPSDAPDDWAMLRDLQKKPDFYKIQPEWVDFKPIPIIQSPKYGDLAALKACEEFKIKSPNDKEALQKAKEEVYKQGFYEGVMLVGDYKGMRVQEAKPLVRKDMIQRGEALPYYEPENQVISRSGDDCIVALCDQWYISYDDQEWKKRVKSHVENHFQTYNPTVKKELLDAIDWIREWGLSRNFGLGTRLPWDNQFLIESLSDSTVYFAYYTVAHYLQGAIDGSKPGTLNITPEQLTLEVWDYLFLGREGAIDAELKPKLDIMRKEFLYWYPMDLRCSGKDLIKNHLIMALFNHAAVWKDFPELWPRGYFCNGYILVDGQKMSKQLGNFKTIDDMLQQYGADASRIGSAEAGDLLDDANYELHVADGAVLKLTTLDAYLQKAVQSLETYRKEAKDEALAFLDKVFENQIHQQTQLTLQAYEDMKHREAIKNGFYVLQGCKDEYLVGVGAEGPRYDLVVRYIEQQVVLLYPIAPHFCEHAYKNYLLPFKPDYPASISMLRIKRPEDYPFDGTVIKQNQYFNDLMRMLRITLTKFKETLTKQKKEKVIQKVTLVVAKDFFDWQKDVLEILNKGQIGEKGPEFDYKSEIKANANNRPKDKIPSMLQFANYVLGEYKIRGAEAINPKLTINEQYLIGLFKKQILSDLKIAELEIIDAEEASKSENKVISAAGQNAQPTKPVALFD